MKQMKTQALNLKKFKTQVLIGYLTLDNFSNKIQRTFIHLLTSLNNLKELEMKWDSYHI
jgi:hypothetical protein